MCIKSQVIMLSFTSNLLHTVLSKYLMQLWYITILTNKDKYQKM